jgi:hypothetical protein
MSMGLQFLILVAVLIVGIALYGLASSNRREDESSSNADYYGGGSYPADGGGD